MNATAEAPTRHAKYITAPTTPHPVLDGGFAALVFSGDRSLLGELPGELTASTPFKYALCDERLNAARDFARTPHMPLPMWEARQLRPLDAVCFVLSDEKHHAITMLEGQGGIQNEHFAVAAEVLASVDESARYQPLIKSFDLRNKFILLLGYGDQGKRIAAFLHYKGQVHARQIRVFDENFESRASAKRDGFSVIDSLDASDDVALVIYSPLMRYEWLYKHFQQLHFRNVDAFDNSSSGTKRDQFCRRGHVWLEPAADRMFAVDGHTLTMKHDHVPVHVVHVVREEFRRLASREVTQLTSGHIVRAHESTVLAERARDDKLSRDSFLGVRRTFVSLQNRPAAPVFAARSLCADLWPVATEQVFPATSVHDLGLTAFERLIKRHIDGAEIIAPSQTSPQRVVLGIAAAQYAPVSPIIEIGSALGGSGLLMACATSDSNAPYISVDPETATRQIMRWGFEQHSQHHRLQQIIETSDHAIDELLHLRDGAGLVFIDGLHTEAAMLSDYLNYAPLVRIGGALLVHDVEPARYSVLRVVLEHVLADVRFEPKCLVDGLLVLERIA